MASTKSKAASAKSVSTALQAPTNGATAMQVSGALPGYKVKALLTVPLMLVPENQEAAVKVIEEIREVDRLKLSRTEKAKAGIPEAAGAEQEKPMNVARVINLIDGSINDLILQAVVMSALTELEGGYVGKCFAIRNLGKKKGRSRDYMQMQVVEIEADAAQ